MTHQNRPCHTLRAGDGVKDRRRVQLATCRRETPTRCPIKFLRQEKHVSIFQHIARAARMGAIAVLVAASWAAAEEGGRYWVPTTTNAATYWVPSTTSPATHQPSIATRSTKRFATKHMRKRSPRVAMARSAPDPKAHRLILQVNTNDPAAMNLALNNATNVTQHFKERGEKVKIEVVTFGPGLHMLRDDTSPVKARIKEMALSTP